MVPDATLAPSPALSGVLGDARELVLLGDGRRRLDRLLGLWDVLVDPKVGVIRRVFELKLDEDDPNFFHYLSTSANTARFSPYRSFNQNGGVSVHRYVAIAKAMGEAVERYCSAIFRRDELPLMPYRELGRRAVHPELLQVYRPEQYDQPGFRWKPIDEDSPIFWTEGVSLVDGDKVLVPAAMIYIPFVYAVSGGDTPFFQPISTGLACGCSFAETVLSGLCEVVERDAFTITWQARLSRPRLRRESLPAAGRDLLARYDAVGIDVQVMDVTTDVGWPTFMTLALGDSGASPAVTVAASTDPSAEVALVKCLEELAHTRKYSKQLMSYTPEVPVEPEAGHPRVQGQWDHLRFYCPQSAKAYAEFAWASPELKDFEQVADPASGDAQRDLENLVAEIAAAGYEPVACDLTTPDIAALGLSVVHTIVPGFHPLHMGHQNRALGVRRLYEVPQKLGYQGLEPGESDNPYPHPFP